MGVANIQLVINIPVQLERILILPLLLYRRLRFGYAFRKISLTRGKHAIVDPIDFARLSRYKWYAHRAYGHFYAARWACRKKSEPKRTIWMHREVLNPPKSLEVDHINHNPLDNRTANLRLATHRQNLCNRRNKTPNATSKYRGVSLHKNTGRWQARIKVNGHTKYLGLFTNQIDAAKAYDNAAKKYNGQFAYLNIPIENKRWTKKVKQIILTANLKFKARAILMRAKEIISAISVLSAAIFCCQGCNNGVYLANGIKIAEVTHHSVIIWSRATAVKKPDMKASKFEYSGASQRLTEDYKPLPEGLTINQMEGAVPGKAGRIRLILTNPDGDKIVTEYKHANPNKDFTCQFKISNLKSYTQYKITAQAYPSNSDTVTTQLKGRFRTAPTPDQIVPILCTSASDQAWWDRDDAKRGFKVYDTMRNLSPDFFVHSGDFVYYDWPGPFAVSTALAHHKWNRMCSLPSLMDFYRKVPSYFSKDDHDTLKDDSYPQSSPLGELTFQQAVNIWYEQMPIESKPYRTFRWGKDLQIWLIEGREYRSSNKMPDGPDKTILGKEQKQWLIKTVTESDATFKLLFSPGPIVGPDRDTKRDNYSNKAFKTEGDWLRKFLADQKNMYVINGDRHWQYVSVDPATGLREYDHGPASDQHAGGWRQQDFRQQHKFLRVKGGFIAVKVERKAGSPTITFTLYDIIGNPVYTDSIHPEH